MLADLFPKHILALHDLSVTNTVEDHPRAGPCWLVGGDVYNSGTVAFLQVFDAAAASVTLGTTVPRYTLALAATGITPINLPRPLLCATALSYAVTATRTGAAAPGAACSVSLIYAH
jgi:hypothetical protein